MFLICSILISFSGISEATDILRENAIAYLKSYDFSNSPEKVYLVARTEMFLYKLELAEASPSENRLAVMEGWFEVVRGIVESGTVFERSVNIVSSHMERVLFKGYRDLTSIVLRLYLPVIRDTGIDILELLPEDTFANKPLVQSIYQLLATTGSVDFDEIPIIHDKSQEALEKILHNVTRLNSYYIALQRANPAFPFRYEPIHEYLYLLTRELPSDVSGSMIAMDLILPIQRLVFSMFDRGELWQTTQLYDACYSKIRIDKEVIESIFRQLVEDLGSLTDLDAALNRIRLAIDSVDGIDGELVDKEVPEYDQIRVESGFTPVEGIRSFIHRFFGPEKATLLSTAFESWAGTVHPAQISLFFLTFRKPQDLSTLALSNLADIIAEKFGINLYSFGYVDEDKPWKTEFVHQVIARDPRFSLTGIEMTEPIARFILRSRRDSFKHFNFEIELYFREFVKLKAKPGNELAAEGLIRKIETIMLGHEARDIATCGMGEDCAHLVLEKLVPSDGINPYFMLLNKFYRP